MRLPVGEGPAGNHIVVQTALRVGFVKTHETVGVVEGQRLQKDGVDDSKERDVRADAEADDEDSQDRQKPRERESVRTLRRTSCTSCSSHCQLHVSRACSRSTTGIAEGTQGRVARFFCVHAGRDIFRDLLIEVELQFVIEHCVVALPTQEERTHLLCAADRVSAWRSGSLHDEVDGFGEAVPIGCFGFELLPAGRQSTYKTSPAARSRSRPISP